MTIHAAKGLEFSHVFVCSLSEGVLPSRKTRTVEAMEEERRLAFVAFTRAKDGLYLTEAEASAIRERRDIRRGSSSISILRPWSFQIGLLTPSSMTPVALMRRPIVGSLTRPGRRPSNLRALPIKRSDRAWCRASTSRSGLYHRIRRFGHAALHFVSRQAGGSVSKPEEFQRYSRTSGFTEGGSGKAQGIAGEEGVHAPEGETFEQKIARIKRELDAVPTLPGVYLWKDKHGRSSTSARPNSFVLACASMSTSRMNARRSRCSSSRSARSSTSWWAMNTSPWCSRRTSSISTPPVQRRLQGR